MYTETESIENEKEQQIKLLQQKESQALANDNYDEAEETSYRMEQLKADLESSHYKLPAQDDKVNISLSCHDLSPFKTWQAQLTPLIDFLSL